MHSLAGFIAIIEFVYRPTHLWFAVLCFDSCNFQKCYSLNILLSIAVRFRLCFIVTFLL